MLMAITRINECQAHWTRPRRSATFFVRSLPASLTLRAAVSCERLVQHDDPTRGALIEVWDRVAAHQTSVSRIPPGLLQQAQSSVAVPVRGAYYHRVSDE